MFEGIDSSSSSGSSSSFSSGSSGSESMDSPSTSDTNAFDSAMSSEHDYGSSSDSYGGFDGLGIGNPGSYGGQQTVDAPGFGDGYSYDENRDENGNAKNEDTGKSAASVAEIDSLQFNSNLDSLYSSHQELTAPEDEQKAAALEKQAQMAGMECLAAHQPVAPMTVDKPICMAIDPQGLEHKGILDYIGKSANQIVKGNYTDDVTALGTAGQVGLGLVGADLPADIRDITYDFTHWENSWGHVGTTLLDLASVLPVVGAFKNVDEVGTLIKGGSKVDGAVKQIDIDNITVKDIPTFKSGEFNDWFDARSPDEIQQLYNKSKGVRRKIEDGLRADGGMHEYLKVSKAPQWKEWGVRANQVQQDYAVPTEKMRWTIPETGLPGGHRIVDPETGGFTAPGSRTYHLELDDLINNCSTLQNFDEGLDQLNNRWGVHLIE